MLMEMDTSSASWADLKRDWTYILGTVGWCVSASFKPPLFIRVALKWLFVYFMAIPNFQTRIFVLFFPHHRVFVASLTLYTFRLELDKYVQGLHSSLQTPEVWKKYSNHDFYVFITIWLSYLHACFSCRTSTQRCGLIWADGTRSRWCTFIEWFRWFRATSASCCMRWVFFFIVAVCWSNDGWCRIWKESFYFFWFMCCLYRTEHNVQNVFLPESDKKEHQI